MRHSEPKAQLRRKVTQAVHESEGQMQNVLGQTFHSTMQNTYPDSSKLPTVMVGGPMQSPDGLTYFQLDHSLLDGDHVLAP